jgi:Zn-dependent M28 family amino/carboxypeptidase
LRNVIIAFWDGEEKGLLGSKHFVQSCDFIGKVKGYLNFDMIGRNNKPDRPRHVVYFYTAAHPAFGQWLKDDIARYGLALEPDYRAWDRPATMPRSPCATSPSSGITRTDIPTTTSPRTTPTA